MGKLKINSLSSEKITEYMRHKCPEPYVDLCVTSTNDMMRISAENGAPEGFIIAADSQSNGRGRVGKSFYSPEGGLYMSILLRPQMKASDALRITTLAAVTTAEAIEEVTGEKVSIKWVNDLYLNDKKVCGILTEAPYDQEHGSVKYAVLGIGINVVTPIDGFGDLESVAMSITDVQESEPDVKNRLAAIVADKFFDRYENISDKAIFDEYKKRLFILGQDIYVIKQGDRIKARVIDLKEDYSLTVKYENGEIRDLSSGEISIKPM